MLFVEGLILLDTVPHSRSQVVVAALNRNGDWHVHSPTELIGTEELTWVMVEQSRVQVKLAFHM